MHLESQVDNSLPFVLFKKPHSGQIHLWQQNNTQVFQDKTLKTSGYYFVPFDLLKHPAIVFPENITTKQTFFLRNFKEKTSNQLNQVATSQEAENRHKQNVAKAISLIAQNKLDKVIISRKQEVAYDKFSIFDAFLRLANHHDASYVFLWYHPEVETWLGATPELLVKYTNGQHLQTMALAGTLPVQNGEPVIWQAKEIKEQQFVTEYIVEKIQEYGKNVKVSTPKTVFQGKLAHIKTDITAEVTMENIRKIIKNLHPTPAVCGLPTAIAQKYIYELETYDRKYYTGFLGEITSESVELYVNLRSLEVLGNKILLYVGGGIVKDSDPEKEWLETIIKSKILLSYL